MSPADEEGLHVLLAVFIQQRHRAQAVRLPPRVVVLQDDVAFSIVRVEILRDRDEQRKTPGRWDAPLGVDLGSAPLRWIVCDGPAGARDPERERGTDRAQAANSP
jgi:hypothetical protein